MSEIRRVAGGTPVFGVVEPGVEAALAAGAGTVLVLATRATVSSGAYGRALRARLPEGAQVIEQACPLFAPMIEEGWIDHPILHQTIGEYVGRHREGEGVALLACTHYPWIQPAIARALPRWKIVNSAEAVARAVQQALRPSPAGGRSGAIDWRFTDPMAVPAFARAEFSQI